MTSLNHNTNYQLHNGDCLEVMPTLPANSVDAVICDPPYGTTACSWDTVIPFDDMWACIKHVLKPKGAVVLFGSEPFSSHLRLSNLEWYKYDWIWQKSLVNNYLNSHKQPLRTIELVSVFYNGQCVYNPQMRTGFKAYTANQGKKKSENYGHQPGATTISNGDRFPIDLLEFKKDKKKLHPTQKPIALMEYLVKTYTNPAQTVLDFTMGSGTTGVACGKLGRNFVGIELLQEYYDIAETRIKNTYGDFVLTEEEKETGQMSLF